MSKENHTKYALLGLLTTNCRSGYAIKQMIDQSLNHFWKISYGQIYPNLKKLAKEDLATVVETSQEGKPDKKEYHITQKGLDTLQKWLEKPISPIQVEKNELLLKLFFSRNQAINSTLNHLTSYKEMLQSRLDTYEIIEKSICVHDESDRDPIFWLITLDYGKRTTIACMEWCDASIEKIEKMGE